jgi:putative flippase GtrA
MSRLRHILDHARQLTRFAAVGLTCFIVSLGVLTGLHELAGVYYLVAYGAAFVVSSTLGYLLNGRFTFGQGADGPGVLRYMTVNFLLLLVNGAALRVLVEYFHIWYLGATLLLAAINTPISFLAHRLISYRLGPRQAAAGGPPERAIS